MKKNKNNLKEPFVRIVKRDNIKLPKIILIYSIAIVGGLLLSGLISVLFSENFKLIKSSEFFKGIESYQNLSNQAIILIGIKKD